MTDYGAGERAWVRGEVQLKAACSEQSLLRTDGGGRSGRRMAEDQILEPEHPGQHLLGSGLPLPGVLLWSPDFELAQGPRWVR